MGSVAVFFKRFPAFFQPVTKLVAANSAGKYPAVFPQSCSHFHELIWEHWRPLKSTIRLWCLLALVGFSILSNGLRRKKNIESINSCSWKMPVQLWARWRISLVSRVIKGSHYQLMPVVEVCVRINSVHRASRGPCQERMPYVATLLCLASD